MGKQDGGARRRAVGAPARRVDGDDKATGRAVYLDDMRVPGMLHAALVFPGCAHAELVAVDASGAKAMPDVAAVLTATGVALGCEAR